MKINLFPEILDKKCLPYRIIFKTDNGQDVQFLEKIIVPHFNRLIMLFQIPGKCLERQTDRQKDR